MRVKKLLPILLVIVFVFGLVIFLLEPSSRSKQSRDQQRIADLQSLKKALDLFVSKNASSIVASDKLLCDGCSNNEEIFSFRETNFNGKRTTSIQSIYVNGTGWLPLDLSLGMKIGETPLQKLPIDPLEKGYSIRANFPTLNFFYKNLSDYTYTFTPGKAGKYKLTAKMESQDGLEKAAADGGSLPDRFEIGPDLNLKP